MLAGLVLSGCNRPEGATAPGAKSPGRYAGIGTFASDRLWAHRDGVADPKEPAAARLADDTQIIVVLDSHTGEVRQCGNHSGYCVTMNPWATAPATAPVKLKKHAADLEAEDQAATKSAEPAATDTPPAR
jgi:hypothetical protein